MSSKRSKPDPSPIYISPSEPASLRALGIQTLLPEEHGVDFYWESVMGRVGVQRKAFPNDFLASVHDGRLNREYAMMKGLDVAVLLLEGSGHWTQDGNLIRDNGDKRWGWTIGQHRNYLSSVQLRGVQVHHSSSIADTARFLTDLRVWTDKADHSSLERTPRPKPSGGFWAEVSNRDYQLHAIQHTFPGIGPTVAKAILDTLGFPFALTVTKEDLMKVPGIAKGRAEKIMKVFESREEK